MGRMSEAAGFADRIPRALVLRPGSRVENCLERVAHEGRPFLFLSIRPREAQRGLGR